MEILLLKKNMNFMIVKLNYSVSYIQLIMHKAIMLK